ncbi:putative inorganic pyrophosphatase [Fasciola gigantica]|uniref:Putative inorganic pyrophosphatase n=1 Tax=Fasciola gigantica TaxID=46835 RepID=A0A504YFZ8_FASGI|nr:putative inorganic pyrophosphatase [Fasciola gigantica]
MAQRIFQSFRRLPGHFTAFNRKTEVGEAQGNAYKAKVRRLITLTESDDVYLWELTVTAQSSVRFVQISCLKNITQKLRSNFVNGVTNVENTDPNEGTNHVTAICVATDGTGFLLGTENGWVASVRLNIPSKLVSKNFDYLTLPTPDEAITPSRILNGLSPNRQHRLRLDAVVVLSERPGFPGQLLIGYSSGLSLIYDLRADRVVVLLPWKHGLEATAWCGGNGLPHRSSSTATPIHLGMRLLTAHSDGSLGVNTKILTALEAAGAHYGPEGRFGRGSAIMHNQNAAGWSGRSWPIRGGLALVNGARLSTSLIDDSALFTDDLLLTGHEDGSVAFWRLSACGCMRRIYTLHTAVLFEGDFGLPGHGNEMEDEIDAWPPFRQAGVFDPFMDDSRAAVQMIRLIDHTVAVGGAAGQITLWQFLDHTPLIKPVTVAIKTDLPGFQWKGYAPLRVRTSLGQGTTTEQAPPSNHSLSNRRPPPQLQATGIILVQPPARITALGLAETPSPSVPSNQCNPYGLLVALGTPHGYSVVHLPPVKPPPSAPPDTQTLWTESTLPDNLDALQEAAAGEGWARRRTRELKKSLRDSFRRLKRMRSTKMSGHPHAVITTEAPAPASSAISRAGVRRTVTQTNRVVGRPVHSGPLEEAERRARGDSGQLGYCSAGLPTVSIEREICDRPSDSASVAIVTCFAFGPPLFRFSSNPLHGHTSPSNQSAVAASVAANCAVGSLFVGTKAGMVKAYALFSDRELNSPDNPLSTFRLQLAKQLILQHRAPILTVRLVDNKSFQPLPSMCLDVSSTVNPRSPNMPNLLVVSEEQVRLFSLPGLRLKFKARITAKDGYRIKTGAVMAFRPCSKFSAVTEKIVDDSACVDLDRSNVSAMSTPLHSPPGENSAEYSFVLSNVGGQAIVLGMPGLARRDTLGLLDASDVVAVNSVTFAEPGCSTSQANNAVIAPALGLYQLAPGQLTTRSCDCYIFAYESTAAVRPPPGHHPTLPSST